MYVGSAGTINEEYKAAVQQYGFRTFAGDDASWQPGDLSDLFMHETVAAWAAHYFKHHPIKDKTIEAVKQRLADCEAYCNSKNVAELTQSLPRRVGELKDAEGGRLPY